MSTQENTSNMNIDSTPAISSPAIQNESLEPPTSLQQSEQPTDVPKEPEIAVQGSVKGAENTGIVVVNADSESLSNLLVYDSDSSSSSSSSSLSQVEIEPQRHSWRDTNPASSEDSTESDDDSEAESTISAGPELARRNARRDPTKSAYDIELDELPPVPDLSQLDLNPEGEKYMHMGSVLAVVDKLVTVGANPGMPAYDLETLLFLDDGIPMGPIFDVLGPVTSPIYAVRFNKVDDINNLKITPGMKVYSLPKSKHTQYVFLQQLLKMKGSDASWLNDREVPVEFADWSDDETESRLKHSKRRHDDDAAAALPDNNSAYKEFEKTMNQRNILNTKLSKCMDSYRHVKYSHRSKPKKQHTPQISTNQVPAFNPAIPPPSMVMNNNEMAAWANYSRAALTNHAYFVSYYGNAYGGPGPSHI